MIKSDVKYPLSIEACESEDLRNTGFAQFGFDTIVVNKASNTLIASTMRLSKELDILIEHFIACKLEPLSNSRYSTVTIGDKLWLHHQLNGLDYWESVKGENVQALDFPEVSQMPCFSKPTEHFWSLCYRTSQSIKEILGASRVMIYRFGADWSGEVISEAIDDNIEPFLGLRYPPTDIPSQARQIFLETRTRHIFSINLMPQAVKVNQNIEVNPDLTHCISKSVSPYHLEYLNNMGTRGTASVAIIIEGQLWGLISIHFADSRTANIEELVFLEAVGHNFNQCLQDSLQYQINKQSKRLNKVSRLFIENLHEYSDPFHTVLLSEIALYKLIAGHGQVILFDEQYCSVGRTPPLCISQSLVESIGPSLKEGETHFANSLPENMQDTDTNGLAGFSLTKICAESGFYILCFKEELKQSVSWGGDPRNIVNSTQVDKRMSPRKSFEKWVELVRGFSAPWSSWHIDLFNDVITALGREMEASPKELALLIKTGMKRTIKQRSIVRRSATEIIDGVKTAIALAVETEQGHSPKLLTINDAASSAFNISTIEAEGMSLEELSEETSIDLSDVGFDTKYIDIISESTGFRKCEISVSVLFEHRRFDNNEHMLKIQLYEFRDVTESKRVEEALISEREKAQNELIVRVQSLAKISHEMKTPLNAILGFASVLMEVDSNFPEQDKQSYIQNIYDAGIHLKEVVSNTLDSSAASMAKDENVVEFSIHEIAEQAFSLLNSLAESRGVELISNVPKDINITCNARALKQILLNLISNALKYNIPDGSVTLSVAKSGADFVSIEVADTGVGMSDEQLSKCVEPYQRFSNQEGSGLGLSITHHMLALMGGHMQMQSEQGKGSLVRVSLPKEV